MGYPGVRAVVTFRDVPENPFEDGDVVAPDGPLAQVYLLNRIVRHVGDEVAQFQLDVYGEVMDALHLARLTGKEPDENAWRV
jgi:GH15 family glucan-1,4-alpha-glucosidase